MPFDVPLQPSFSWLVSYFWSPFSELAALKPVLSPETNNRVTPRVGQEGPCSDSLTLVARKAVGGSIQKDPTTLSTLTWDKILQGDTQRAHPLALVSKIRVWMGSMT